MGLSDRKIRTAEGPRARSAWRAAIQAVGLTAISKELGPQRTVEEIEGNLARLHKAAAGAARRLDDHGWMLRGQEGIPDQKMPRGFPEREVVKLRRNGWLVFDDYRYHLPGDPCGMPFSRGIYILNDGNGACFIQAGTFQGSNYAYRITLDELAHDEQLVVEGVITSLNYLGK